MPSQYNNNKSHKVRHDHDYLMVRISEVSFKIRKIARFYDLDHINLTTTTTITTGYLQKFQDGLLILAVRG